MAEARGLRAKRRGRAITAGVAIGVVVCLAGGGAAWAALRPHGQSYRVASAEKADVTQTASLAGTVASATRADRAFQVSGTVASVGVKVGDTVTAGQTLATLDASALDDAVTQSQQSVSTAQQKLNDDLASQTASASSATASAAAAADASDGGLAPATFVAAASSSASSDLSALAKSVTDAQSTLLSDAAQLQTIATELNDDLTSLQSTTLTSLSTALVAVTKNTDCAAVSDAAGTPTATNVSTCASAIRAALTAVNAATAATAQPSSSTPVTVTDALSDLADQLSALGTLQSATLPNDEKALNTAVSNLQSAAAAASSGSSTGAGSGTPSGAPSGSGKPGAATGSGASSDSGAGAGGASNRSGSASGSGSATRGSAKAVAPASAEQIVSDQASLAAAQANLAVAQQNVGLATLTSPIAGTVAAVGVSAGSSVTAKSTSQVISVIGDDGWIVDTAVTATAIGPLKVGQAASVDVSGVSGTLTGKVTAIGFLNTAADSSTPSYDVTLALTGSGDGLLNGASARLTVDVAKASSVLTVPSSAVHLGTGGSYSVDVLEGRKASIRQVKVGAIGSDRTQITSGLSAGDRVILADLSSTVSSDSTQSGTSRFGGGTGVTGGLGGTRTFGGATRTFGGLTRTGG